MILIFLAVILDWILGDPYSFPHPVRLMGNIISIEEKFFRKIFKTAKGLRLAGYLIVFINIFLGIFPSYLILKFSPKSFRDIFSFLIYYYCISAKMLHYEAIIVKKELDKSLEEGRERLKYIVGRDTKNLSEEEIIRATVETVAENTSDGVVAPLFYMFLFGPIGGLTYKFINTMDSMIAYKNEKYIDLGRAAALTDDLANYIPARFTGFLMALSNFVPKKIINTLKDIKTFGRSHSSPNSGYPESAVASILGIQLGGGQFYKGAWVEKPKIGYDKNPIEKKYIFETAKIMYKSEIIFIVILTIIEFINKIN